MSACTKCNHDHGALGLTITGDTLTRRADASKHMLTKIRGGAWSFERGIVEQHTEIQRIEIIDRVTGEVWRTDRRAWNENSFALTLQGRPQTALALEFWNVPAMSTDTDTDQTPELVQPLLFESREIRGVHYEPAHKPRPRIFKAPKQWKRAA